MEEIDVKVFNEFICPKCDSTAIAVLETLYLGLNTLGKCNCHTCNIQFFHTYPVGHAVYFPVSFSKDRDFKKFSNTSYNWFAEPLIDSFFSGKEVEFQAKVEVLREEKDVVILNCLDNCYGHSLSKLLNAHHYISKAFNKGLVVIIPESLLWLVPKEVSEIWVIKAPLRLLNRRLKGFNEFVNSKMAKFKSVKLSPAYLHHDFLSLDLEKFTKVKTFKLSQFSSRPITITFVFREDRIWISNPFLHFFLKCSIKLSLKAFTPFFIYLQNRKINKIVELIRPQIKEVCFYAVGMGRTGRLSTKIIDKRTINPYLDNQKEWCEIYSKSHLVIGMHGSNMFLPSGLSAAFIELLPRERIINYMEDIIMNKSAFYNNYLSRFLDVYSSPKLIARHAVKLIKGFPQIYSESFLKYRQP